MLSESDDVQANFPLNSVMIIVRQTFRKHYFIYRYLKETLFYTVLQMLLNMNALFRSRIVNCSVSEVFDKSGT